MAVRPRTRRPIAVAVLAASLSLGSLGACSSAGPERGVTAQDVADDTGVLIDDDMIGSEVTVSGEVAEVVGPLGFVIGDSDWTGGPLRVVNFTGEKVTEGDVLRVKGTVRRFLDSRQYEDEFGVNFDESRYAAWEDDHVLVAHDVTDLPDN